MCKDLKRMWNRVIFKKKSEINSKECNMMWDPEKTE